MQQPRMKYIAVISIKFKSHSLNDTGYAALLLFDGSEAVFD